MTKKTRIAVIATALDLEYAAVKGFLSEVREQVDPAGTVYEHGLFEADGSAWHVALTQTGMGNTIAAIETTRALTRFQPDLAMFVGVGGGLNGVAIGDVVVADCVYGYESVRYSEVLESRIKTFCSGYPLVQRANVVSRTGHWHKRITSGATPHSFVGPIASGETIIAGKNTPGHQILEAHCGDSYAVEMEGWGFLHAAHANGDVPAIVIRGISDLAGDRNLEQDLHDQPIAAAHAAAFAFELLATLEPLTEARLTRTRPWRPEKRAGTGPTTERHANGERVPIVVRSRG